MNKFGKIFKKAGFMLKRKSPEILTGFGIVGFGVTVVLACKASKKAEPIIEEHKANMKEIKTTYENGEATKSETVKACVVQTGKTTGKLAVVFGPAIGVGVASAGCFIGSNRILRKENLKIASAYTALDQTFKYYRQRTKDRVGEEVEKEIRHGIDKVTVKEETEDENGKKKTVKKELNVVDPTRHKAYIKYLTKTNPSWRNDMEYMKMMLRGKQSIANDMLREKTFMTMCEVLDLLQFSKDSLDEEDFTVGWIYDLDNPNGDNFIEFDVREISVMNEDGEFEPALSIALNPDGIIIDKIHPFQRRSKR